MYDPTKWLRSQNLRIIDRIRAAAGLGNQSEYSVGVAPSIQPVLLVEPDAAPPLQYRGCTPVRAVANAGFRSEISIAVATGLFPPGGILEFFLTLIPQGTTGIDLFFGPTLTAVTNVSLPYADQRLGLNGAIAVSTKNTAAASSTGNQIGGTIQPGAAGDVIGPLGPFYSTDVPGTRGFLARPNADNITICGIFDWRVLFKAV